MATFGHFAVGLVAGRLSATRTPRPRLTQLGFGVLALAPDLDGIIPGLRHDGPAARLHTPIMSIAGATLVALLARWVHLSSRRTFLSAVVALGSQPAIDTLTHGKGSPLLWPYSGRHYLTDIPGLPTWKPEKKASRVGIQSFLSELAWSLPLFVIAALPLERADASREGGAGPHEEPAPLVT